MQLSKGKVIILYYMRHNINSLTRYAKICLSTVKIRVCVTKIFLFQEDVRHNTYQIFHRVRTAVTKLHMKPPC